MQYNYEYNAFREAEKEAKFAWRNMLKIDLEKRYSVVVIDPPWDNGGYLSRARDKFLDEPYINGRRIEWHLPEHKPFNYALMSLEEIAALPVPSLLQDSAFLFLWTINRLVDESFDILRAWGLRYRFMMAWHKPNGPKPVGYPTYNTEFILCGSVGKPKFRDTKAFKTANYWDAPRATNFDTNGWGRQIEACTKPDGFYELLRRVTASPRLDMFARRRIEGFDLWGNEAPAGRYDLICGICEGVFQAHRRDAMYCSAPCRQRGYRRRRKALQISSLNPANISP